MLDKDQLGLLQLSTISGQSLEVTSNVCIARLRSLSLIDITNFHSHPTMLILQFENISPITRENSAPSLGLPLREVWE